MGYISDIRKYVGHCPIMVTAAMCIIFDEENKRILFSNSHLSVKDLGYKSCRYVR